jgi:hypothetical protein
MSNHECVSDDLRVTSVRDPPRSTHATQSQGCSRRPHFMQTCTCACVAKANAPTQRTCRGLGSSVPHVCTVCNYAECMRMAWRPCRATQLKNLSARWQQLVGRGSWVALPHLRRVRFCTMESCAVALWRRRGTAGAAREYGCDGCRRSCRFSCRRCFCRCCLGVAAAGAGADASATLAIATAAAKRRGGQLGLG